MLLSFFSSLARCGHSVKGFLHHLQHKVDAVASLVVLSTARDWLNHRDSGDQLGAGSVSEEIMHLECVEGFDLVQLYSPFLLLL